MNKKWLIGIISVLLLGVIVIQTTVSFQQRKEMVSLTDNLKQEQVNLKESLANIQSEQEALKSQLQASKETVNALKEDNDMLQKQLDAAQILDEFDLSQLEDMGISSPSEIEQDLINHPEVIPQEGVLGGTMFFTKVVLVNDHWAYAEYEDGHVMGEGLFSYTVDSSDGSIVWGVVSTQMR